MNERPLDLASVLAAYPPHGGPALEAALSSALAELNRKIVVLDDDPTGTQTVNGVSVYTNWSEASIRDGFLSDGPMFYVLTNSRGFSRAHTIAVHEQIGETISRVASDLDRDFVIISRGDSTLRGHYPQETQALARALAKCGRAVDGEVIIPFFPEGGRYTIGDVHMVAADGGLVPAGRTEFAHDRSFGYRSSDLREWVAEKTDGQYPASGVTSVTLAMLRDHDVDAVAARLMVLREFGKLIVNAVTYDDVKVFVLGLCRALGEGKRLLLRSAAALPKVLGGVSDRPLLSRGELVDAGNRNGGLVVIGSHVRRTSEQLEQLRALSGLESVEFDQHTALDPAALTRERARALEAVERGLRQGRDVVLFTRRQRLDVGGGAEAELALAVRISDALSGVVHDLSVRPRFLIAKGGITSSDVGTKGLGVRRATVLGQILPGVPVWRTGAESKFPALSYVIFPGNVGGPDALLEAVLKMGGRA